MDSPYRSGATPDGPRLLAGYRLVGRLASGRLGPVWLAHYSPPDVVGPGTYFCIKQLDATTPAMISELRHAAAISHRNACALFEVLIADGKHHLVMEYLQGGLLSELPRDERLFAGVAAQVRAVISAAHDRGIAHGALTADDVMVTLEGRAVVLGFGTARFRPGAAPTIKGDRTALARLFGDATAAPLTERVIGLRVALACAQKIRHERALSR